MSILITGNTDSFATPLAALLSKEKYRVIIAGRAEPPGTPDARDIRYHPIESDADDFKKVFKAYRFESVIYLAPREENLPELDSVRVSDWLRGLNNCLELCQQNPDLKFYLISSTEVFGGSQDTKEDDPISPNTTNGYLLQAMESTCLHYANLGNAKASIIRIPYLYGNKIEKGLLASTVRHARAGTPHLLPDGSTLSLNFLNIKDLAEFLLTAFEEPYSSQLDVIHLVTPDIFSWQQFGAAIRANIPTASISHTVALNYQTKLVAATVAKKYFGWAARETMPKDLTVFSEDRRENLKKSPGLLAKLQSYYQQHEELIRWVELAGGAGLVEYLNAVTSTLIQFKFIDFRLLFVVLFGTLNGTQFGLLAALIACGSVLASWFQTGNELSLLVYNVENWLPFAVYFIAGAITGYYHDLKENQIKFQIGQVSLINEKYTFLYGVFNEIEEIKEQFREQLMGYRDSFGRIFNITKELDTLQEDDVIYRSLSILEDLLNNSSIAIYTIDAHQRYARLQVNSRQLNDHLSLSLNLEEMTELKTHIATGTLFQNTTLLPDYPAVFIPITNQGTTMAAICLWKASFEQHSLYYINLVKVISGLVQSSLIRAMIFKDANVERMYIPETKILRPDAFMQIIRVKDLMRDSKIASYQMLRVVDGVKDLRQASTAIEKGIRAVDYAGQSQNGETMILLSQADHLNALLVKDRLTKLGIQCEFVE